MSEQKQLAANPRGWRWRYLRHKFIKFSVWRYDEPPDLWTRFVCRVIVGWKVEHE